MAKRKPGRPPAKPDAKKASAALELIAAGKTIRQAAEAVGVSRSMLARWLVHDDELSGRYARARDAQIDAWADEVLEVADDSGFDAQIVDGKAVVDSEAIQRAKLRVDSRKWMLSKLKPERYGDKVTVDNQHSGTVAVEHRPAAQMLQEVRERRAAKSK